MDRVTVEAKIENLYDVTDFVEEKLGEIGLSEESIVSITIAIEEIFVNIASYAYNEQETGTVTLEIDGEDSAIKLKFIDGGVRYNPLEYPDPDINLPPEERDLGGLGIYMMKNTMDKVEYEYKDNKNILTLIKYF